MAADNRWKAPFLIAGLLAVCGGGGANAQDAGKDAFLAQKCNQCHAVSSAGIVATATSEKMKGPDLTGEIAKLGVDWARKFVVREVQKDGKQHKKEYKGSAEDLDAILAWLAKQSKP
jgi:mono/diheme cytochrome c family protein